MNKFVTFFAKLFGTFLAIFTWLLYRKKIWQYNAWCAYECGAHGAGPTFGDFKPDFPKPTKLPKYVKNGFDQRWQMEAYMRRLRFFVARAEAMEYLPPDDDPDGLPLDYN